MGRKRKNVLINDQFIIEPKETKTVKNRGMVVGFRITQALCFGVFALGLSMMSGDYSSYINLPISAISITTTIFGGMGAFLTGSMANQCQKW